MIDVGQVVGVMMPSSPVLTGESYIAYNALVVLEVWMSPHRSVISR